MALGNSLKQGLIPEPPDTEGWRHWGDGYAGTMHAARLQGYDSGSLAWVDVSVNASGQLVTSGGGGGGGGAVTVADGADVAQGSTGDASTATTVIGRLKKIVSQLPAAPGQTTMAGSLPVAIASDQTSLTVGTHAVTQSGTWTVQPGNTANTTAWKVDGSAVTQPVSGTVTANAGSGPWPVTDNSGSLTVDAPVATPVFVRLSDGAAAITTLPVSGTVAVSNFTDGGLTDTQLRASAVNVSAAQSGNWTLTGSDGLQSLPVSARQRNGYTHLFVHDAAINETLSQILLELVLLREGANA